MEVQVLSSAQKETSSRVSADDESAKGGSGGKRCRRKATKDETADRRKWAVLSRIFGFVPIFWTSSFIFSKSSCEDKKLASFVSKIQLRKGSFQFFPPFSKSFFLSFKARISRINLSFFFKYIGFGISSSKYVSTNLLKRNSIALISFERF